jgi:hypoxanthine-guanine phosphoribosyltransferase
MLEKDIERVLITKEEIQARCEELGKELTEDIQRTKSISCWYFKRRCSFYGRYCTFN